MAALLKALQEFAESAAQKPAGTGTAEESGDIRPPITRELRSRPSRCSASSVLSLVREKAEGIVVERGRPASTR
jgi:hypothetical protein